MLDTVELGSYEMDLAGVLESVDNWDKPEAAVVGDRH